MLRRTPSSRRRSRTTAGAAALLTALAILFPLAERSDAATLAPPATLKSDCSADVGVAMQSWLDTVPDGSTVDFGTGCYLVNAVLHLEGHNDVTFLGGRFTRSLINVTVGAKTVRTATMWWLGDSTGITFVGTQVEGVNTKAVYNVNYEAQHGFGLGGSAGTKLVDVSVRNVFGDCVAFGESTSAVVSGLRCDGAGRQGVSFTNSTGATLAACDIRRVARSAMDVEPMAKIGQHVRDTLVSGCSVQAPIGNAIVAGGGSGGVTNLTIENLTVKGKWMWVMLKPGTPRRSGLVLNNLVSDTPRPAGLDQGIVVDGWDHALLRDLVAPVKPPAKASATVYPWLTIHDVTDLHLEGVLYGGAGTMKIS